MGKRKKYQQGSTRAFTYQPLSPRELKIIRYRVITRCTAREWRRKWKLPFQYARKLWKRPEAKTYRAHLERKLDDEYIKAVTAHPIAQLLGILDEQERKK